MACRKTKRNVIAGTRESGVTIKDKGGLLVTENRYFNGV